MATFRGEVTMKRKGPWAEQEDLQLVCFVRLFGERRWDYIAKVSGLNRTGKSCRLRWVNYLHPGLKRGRMTPQEEHLVLELHSRWGNRWSRIARKLPGRTDNEIKNYWRTHMRKMAQEKKKKNASPPASSSVATEKSRSLGEADRRSLELNSSGGCLEDGSDDGLKGYSMDRIWEEIETHEAMTGLSFHGSKDEVSSVPYPSLPSPAWECCYYDWLWKIDDEELRKLNPVG